MPSANARNTDENQEAGSSWLDDADALDKFVNTFGAIATLLGSPHEGERMNASVLIIRLLKTHGLHFVDIINGWRESRTAVAANTLLLTEIAALRAENEQLRAERSNGTQNALWADVGVKLSDAAKIAQWVLDLHARQVCGITMKEVDFLQHMARWRGQLRPKQEAWLRDIVVGVGRRTGKTPPPS